MATILAHIQVRVGEEARFEAISRELYRKTLESEAGCRRYEYWRGAERGLYYALLAFDDFNAFLIHQTSEHHENASPELGEVIERIKLEWVDPVASASPLPHTDMLPLAEGADALTRSYHKAYAAQVQEWWLKQRAAESDG